MGWGGRPSYPRLRSTYTHGHSEETQTQADTGIVDTRRDPDIHTHRLLGKRVPLCGHAHTHTPTEAQITHEDAHPPSEGQAQTGTRPTGMARKQRHRPNAHTHSQIHRQAHREERRTQNPKIHTDPNRRIHKQQYSDSSTRRGCSQTPPPPAKTEGPRRGDTPRDVSTQRGNAQGHTNRGHSETQQHAQEDTPSFTLAPPEGHTPILDVGVCSAARGPESAPGSSPNGLAAPRCPLQPTLAEAHFLRASLNKGPPAVNRPWVCTGRCASPVRLGRPQPSTRIPKWRCGPCAAPRGQPSPHQQSPPFPAPGAQHRASLSPLLPARPITRQTFPWTVPAPGSLAWPGPG